MVARTGRRRSRPRSSPTATPLATSSTTTTRSSGRRRWGLNTPINTWLKKTYWASSVFNIGEHLVRLLRGEGRHRQRRPAPLRALLPDGRQRAPSPLGPFRDISGSAPIQCQPASHRPVRLDRPVPLPRPRNGNELPALEGGRQGRRRESALMSSRARQQRQAASPDRSPCSCCRPTARPPGKAAPSRTRRWSPSTARPTCSTRRTTRSGRTPTAAATTRPATRSARVRSVRAPRPHGGTRSAAGQQRGQSGAGRRVTGRRPDGKLYLAYATYWLGENRNGYHPRRLHIAGLVQNADQTLRVG